MKMIREIKQYQATDGTCFNTREEAEQYEEMLQNPHFKKLQERIEKLVLKQEVQDVINYQKEAQNGVCNKIKRKK